MFSAVRHSELHNILYNTHIVKALVTIAFKSTPWLWIEMLSSQSLRNATELYRYRFYNWRGCHCSQFDKYHIPSSLYQWSYRQMSLQVVQYMGMYIWTNFAVILVFLLSGGKYRWRMHVSIYLIVIVNCYMYLSVWQPDLPKKRRRSSSNIPEVGTTFIQ